MSVRRWSLAWLLSALWTPPVHAGPSEPLVIDSSHVDQPFYGIGGLSGGGATSRLLVDYVEPQRSQILDYLFKPNYGASLHLLKVEIGGDSQSTDGTEPSHMHSPDDLDYNRGYEWWLLKEAKKRNPEIKTYGLPWAYPGWVGGPERSGSPFKHPELTSKYIMRWLEGARNVHRVEIDYIGIWNERASSGTYAKMLRRVLDSGGFPNTTLVAKDGGVDICSEMAKDSEYADAIGVVGLHYPSDFDKYDVCRGLGFGIKGGKPMWSSEESSSYDDLNGAACWARIIAAHYVLQGFTSSIMWNLAGAYYHGTNWYASSMLTSVEPWSGHYEALEVVWATAHVTQFTKVGWNLLALGKGSGELPKGGYYTTYADPRSGNWTLVVVKIDRDHASCTRPELPGFSVSDEEVTFQLTGPTQATEVAVWYSNFEEVSAQGKAKTIFTRLPNIPLNPKRNSFVLQVNSGSVYTVSTILTGPSKGEPAMPIPASQPSMPLPYSDDFESCAASQEGKWWADQIGAFEVHAESGDDSDVGSNRVMRQMVPDLPIGWSDPGSNGPMTLLGMREWQDISVEASFKLPEGAPENASGCVGSRVDQMWANGLVLCVSAGGSWSLSVGGPKLGTAPKGDYARGTVPLPPGSTLGSGRLSLTTVGDRASGSLEVGGQRWELFQQVRVRDLDTGFAALGASDWFAIEFDDVRVAQAGPRWHPRPTCRSVRPGASVYVTKCMPNGVAADDQAFELLSSWGIRHVKSGLCVAVAPPYSSGAKLLLEPCDPAAPMQQFRNDYTLVRNDVVPFTLQAFGSTLLLTGNMQDLSVTVKLKSGLPDLLNGIGMWQAWSYFPNTKQLRNQYVANLRLGYPVCLTACSETNLAVGMHYV